MSFHIHAATDLVGKKVMNSAGDDLGKLDKLMIDAVNGQVAYAVLSFGGHWGFGDKLFAVPFQALDYDMEAECFIFEVTKEQLEEAPQFEETALPTGDEELLDDVYLFYGIDPYWQRRQESVSVNKPGHPAAVPSSTDHV